MYSFCNFIITLCVCLHVHNYAYIGASIHRARMLDQGELSGAGFLLPMWIQVVRLPWPSCLCCLGISAARIWFLYHPKIEKPQV